MTVGQIAGLIAAIAFLILVIWVGWFLTKVVKNLADLSNNINDLTKELDDVLTNTNELLTDVNDYSSCSSNCGCGTKCLSCQ